MRERVQSGVGTTRIRKVLVEGLELVSEETGYSRGISLGTQCSISEGRGTTENGQASVEGF